MISTRFGSKILSVEWFDEESGDVSVVVETDSGRAPARSRCWHVSELKATGGINEIVAAAKTIRGADASVEHPEIRPGQQGRCCSLAKLLSPCSCHIAWTCPEHGDTHCGSHD
jgi:hypothetical protein